METCGIVLLQVGYQCSQHVGGFHGRLPHHPGKWIWRPKRVVLVVEGGSAISDSVVVVRGLKVVVPQPWLDPVSRHDDGFSVHMKC
jgi:hypothetical protein